MHARIHSLFIIIIINITCLTQTLTIEYICLSPSGETLLEYAIRNIVSPVESIKADVSVFAIDVCELSENRIITWQKKRTTGLNAIVTQAINHVSCVHCHV